MRGSGRHGGPKEPVEDWLSGNAALRRLADANVIGVISGEGDDVLGANDCFLAMVGHTREDLATGRINWRTMTAPEWAAADAAAHRESVETGTVRSYQKEYLRKDGSRVSVLLGGATVDAGPPLRWVSFVVDLSAQKAAEARASRSGALLDALVSAAPIGIAFLDTELRFVLVNERLAEINGLSVAAHLGRRPDELLPAELAEPNLDVMRQVLATGKPVLDFATSGETPAAPGVRHDWLVSYYPVRDEKGGTLGLGASVVDVTERTRMEEELRAAEERFRGLVSAGVVGVIGGVGERILEANDRFLDMLGYTWADFDAAGGLVCPRITPAEWAGVDRSVLAETLATGLAHPFEKEYLRKDGSRVPVLVASAVLGRQPLRWLSIVTDMTEQKQAQRRLQQAYHERDAVARILQRSLLPPTLPAIPGGEVAARFLPAGAGNLVGGDFYDLYQTGPHSWHLVIGDVCGKGPEAAAVTALVRYTLRAGAIRQDDPADVLALANKAILRDGSDRFCTVAYAVLDVDRHPVRCTIALPATRSRCSSTTAGSSRPARPAPCSASSWRRRRTTPRSSCGPGICCCSTPTGSPTTAGRGGSPKPGSSSCSPPTRRRPSSSPPASRRCSPGPPATPTTTPPSSSCASRPAPARLRRHGSAAPALLARPEEEGASGFVGPEATRRPQRHGARVGIP